MKELFTRRRRAFLARCIGYLRYVLNDHFVLVLMVLIGFLAYQYRELLLHFPENPIGVMVLLALVTVFLLLLGRPATYLEEADQHFVLPKEGEVRQMLQAALRRTVLLWNSVQLLGQIILTPLYLRLGLPAWALLLYFLVLVGLKTVYHWRQVQLFEKEGVFQWDQAIAAEKRRKQGILQFYALFTNVKGITTGVKRRAYLDRLIQLISRGRKNTWFYLYLRGFMRSGDYLMLTLRLLVLALAVLVLVPEAWLAVLLAALFHYLTWFQLASLAGNFDYQYLTRLYPQSSDQKVKGLSQVIRLVTYTMGTLELLIGLVFVARPLYLLALIAFFVFLNQLYLPIKLKKVID